METNEYLMWLTKYVCADCSPRDDDDRFEQEYAVFVNRGQPCPLDHCPQCGGYLGFTEMGDYLTRHKALIPAEERP